MGDLPCGFGWPETINKSWASEDRSNSHSSFLKPSNVMGKRYAHQFNVMVLNSFMKRANELNGAELALEDWVVVVSQ